MLDAWDTKINNLHTMPVKVISFKVIPRSVSRPRAQEHRERPSSKSYLILEVWRSLVTQEAISAVIRGGVF